MEIETDRGQRAAADGLGPFGAGNARTDGPRITRVGAPSPPCRDRRVGSLFSTRAVHQRLYRQLCTQLGCFGAWQARNHYQTAHASRYTGPDFREVIR